MIADRNRKGDRNMKQEYINGEGFVMRDTDREDVTQKNENMSARQENVAQDYSSGTMNFSGYQQPQERTDNYSGALENTVTQQFSSDRAGNYTNLQQGMSYQQPQNEQRDSESYRGEETSYSQTNREWGNYQRQSERTNVYQQPTEETRNYEQQPQEQRVYSYSNMDYNPYQQAEKSKKKETSKKKGNFAKRAALIAASAVLFGGIAGGSFYGINRLAENMFYEEEQAKAEVVEVPEEKKVVTTTTATATNTTVTDVTNVVQTVMPSVVSITSKSTEITQSFFGQAYEYETEGSGSGIIIGQSDTELLIATNNHVVAGADELTIYFINDETATAKIKGTDSDMDLAVIAVDISQMSADTLGAISVATLGDSDALQVGEPAIAIGNALGYGQSVTTGVISALDRSVDGEGESEGFIQTDAAINPGNSGGALLNVHGQVIGINSMKISAGGYAEATIEGMGYAIPISAAKPIIDELMNKVTRDKVTEDEMGYLGIRGATIGDEMHEVYNMPYGIYISEVVQGSAAQKAGLLPGDVIVKFDGTKISSYEELQNQLQYYKAGETIELVVQRPVNGAYEDQKITLTLGSRSEIDN